MNAAILLLGLTMGQPAQPDYFPFMSRKISLPLQYKRDRATIREAQLWVSRDQGATWEMAAIASPKETSFSYEARDDGIYWFQFVLVDLHGKKDLQDCTKEPPAMKVLVDTMAPIVRITECRRQGEEVVVQWTVEDRFWNEAATKVYFRAVDAGESAIWREVKLSTTSKTGVRFSPKTAGPVHVKVIAQDLAGTKTEASREVPGSGVVSTSTSLRAPVAAPPLGTFPAPPRADAEMPLGPPNMPMPLAEPAAPMMGTPIMTAPVMPPTAPVMPPTPAAAMSPVPPQAAPTAMGMMPIATGQGLMTPAAPAMEGPAPIASTTPHIGTMPPHSAGFGDSPAPRVEQVRVPVINKIRFDLAYEVESKGPSGISRVDLWATRDDGRTWHRWSQHDGHETPIRVALDTPANRKLEGPYGFRLVPVSGTGLSDAAPAPGDAPDMRVVVNVTPPVIDLYQPTSDPNAPDTLVIPWRAADDNFGEDPITIEWSEHANGPWKPVLGSPDGVIAAGSVVGGAATRLPNTSKFAWRVPASLPTHKVYLKLTARDLAGNNSEVISPGPILVDLARPRARIQGIVPAMAPAAVSPPRLDGRVGGGPPSNW